MDDSSETLRLFTLPQAAKLLHGFRRTLDRMIHKQKLPAFKVDGRWRLPESQLTEWIERHEQLARVARGPAGGSLCWRNDADNVARC
jgi:excisionase family DNA binding protein